MVIGVDFDNTLICYDQLFHRLALEGSLIAETVPVQKKAIRDALRARPLGEIHWQRLQGLAYGSRILEAPPAEGALDFLRGCAGRGIPVFIISHKTKFASQDPTRTSLRAAAADWLKAHGFLDGTGLTLGSVFFGSSREEKLAHIRTLRCTHFIDDLEETFREPGFPEKVRRFLYQPGTGTDPVDLPDVEIANSWAWLGERILGV